MKQEVSELPVSSETQKQRLDTGKRGPTALDERVFSLLLRLMKEPLTRPGNRIPSKRNKSKDTSEHDSLPEFVYESISTLFQSNSRMEGVSCYGFLVDLVASLPKPLRETCNVSSKY